MNLVVTSLFCAVALAACGNSSATPLVCTGEAEAAVLLTLRDATTQQPVTGATITLTDGAYSEVMLDSLNGQYLGGLERPGTYMVEISASQYLGQTIVDVVAPALPCGPETQRIDIALQPGASPVIMLLEGSDGGWQMASARVLHR